MTTKLHPKTVQTQATIKKVKFLTLKENPLTQRFIASKLGISSGTQNILETIFEEEIPTLYGKEIDKFELHMDKASRHRRLPLI
ncbi:hypothetical protein TNCV_2361521 [Trichonephila clavipes]|nr:hypothetical protein TNCV_2361521 [Trichonephila clavipes]